MKRDEDVYIPESKDFINYLDEEVTGPLDLSSKVKWLKQMRHISFIADTGLDLDPVWSSIYSFGSIKLNIPGVYFDIKIYDKSEFAVRSRRFILSSDIDWKNVIAFSVVKFGELTTNWMVENVGEKYFIWSTLENKAIEVVNRCEDSDFLRAYSRNAYLKSATAKFAFDVNYSTVIPTIDKRRCEK